nr:hypothetical protein [Tanacetum cinerariifolium]
MTLTFAETHNMVAYLTKSDASKGFNQIIDFLNGSSIKYALTVNPNIYVLCIKQFWSTVAVKKVNDVTRLQALVDKKKVVVTKATIRDALRLDDAKGVECLLNKEIFVELARMGYKKPSTKLTFFKAFFSSQWKFLIHTILQCKGFSGVKTLLFEGMLVAQEVEQVDVDENVENVNIGDATEGNISAAHDEVPTGGMIADMDADVILEEAKDVTADAKDDQDADVQVNVDIQGRTAESQTEIYKIDLDHANKVVTTASTTITAADVPISTATTAAALKVTSAPSKRTKGVVIRDLKDNQSLLASHYLSNSATQQHSNTN